MEGFILMKLILPLFINTLSHHQKCLHDSLFNVHEIPTETGLTDLLRCLLHSKRRATTRKCKFARKEGNMDRTSKMHGCQGSLPPDSICIDRVSGLDG
jgi:hypothetical protein